MNLLKTIITTLLFLLVLASCGSESNVNYPKKEVTTLELKTDIRQIDGAVYIRTILNEEVIQCVWFLLYLNYPDEWTPIEEVNWEWTVEYNEVDKTTCEPITLQGRG